MDVWPGCILPRPDDLAEWDPTTKPPLIDYGLDIRPTWRHPGLILEGAKWES